MRVCLFAPDTGTFAPDRLQPLVPAHDPAVEEVLLTNSWGETAAVAPSVHVTAGAATFRMRALRWLLRQNAGARLTRPAARAMMRLAAADLIEGLRAADPDIVVSLDPAWAEPLRQLIHRHQLPWPCVVPGDAWTDRSAEWRRYESGLRVSIVLPTYNGTQYLLQSLESCLTQTHRNLEVVVVDDGSGAEVREIIAGVVDPRVKYVRHEVNRGLPQALNTGFAHASGDLLTWTSDDNYYAPNAVEEMVAFLCTYPQVDFVYADAYEIDPAGAVVGMLRTKPPEWLKVKNRVGGCFLYKRSVYETIGSYDRGAVLAEDYDYWLRVARRFTMQRLLRPLYYYRFHPASLTGRFDRARVREQAERVKRLNKARWLRYRGFGRAI